MDFEYSCNLCNYHTNRKIDYYSHLNTKRHNDKVFKPDLMCYYCNKGPYSNKFTYQTHITKKHHTYHKDETKVNKKSKKTKEIITSEEEDYISNKLLSAKEVFNYMKKQQELHKKEQEKLKKSHEKSLKKQEKKYEKELEVKNKQIKVMNSVAMTALKYARVNFTEAKQLKYEDILIIRKWKR